MNFGIPGVPYIPGGPSSIPVDQPQVSDKVGDDLINNFMSWFNDWKNGISKGPIGSLIDWIKGQIGSSSQGDSTSGSLDDTLQHLVDSETGSESLLGSDDPSGFLAKIASATGDDAWLEKYADFIIDRYFMDANQQYNSQQSDTAFSRLINDIKSTGYNPWLAFQSGIAQASSPTSSGASGSNVSSSAQRTSRENNAQNNKTDILSRVLQVLGLLILKA